MNCLRRALRLTALSALAGAALASGPGAAAAHAACADADARPGEAGADARALATVCLVNEERRRHGLPTLRIDPRLTTSAQRHAEDMRARGYFAHVSPDGLSPSDRARAAGYPMGAGENLARHSQTPAQTVQLWLNSPSHRDNVLLADYRGIGMGLAGDHWVHTFGYSEPPADRHTSPASGPLGSEAAASGAHPARLRVRRAGVVAGRLGLLAGITRRANGERVTIRFLANGRRSRFTQRVSRGRVRVDRALPRGQRQASTGIVEVRFAGSQRVRPAAVRLRAARGTARRRG